MMEINSPAFTNGASIPARYTCDGDDACPELVFSDVPGDAASLVLIVDDPDAPNGTWTHWTAWNIPSDTNRLSGDALPDGTVEGVTSAGTTGWHGPCPPSGIHRYVFTLFALDTKLPDDAGMDAHALRAAIKSRVTATATLTGTYSRKNG